MIRLQYGRHPHWPQGIPESRQAGGRNGAGRGVEWSGVATKVDRNSAVRQEARGKETDNGIACGAAQPQSQAATSQQPPPVALPACSPCEASGLEPAGAESGA
jgi:hypothetical protein